MSYAPFSLALGRNFAESLDELPQRHFRHESHGHLGRRTANEPPLATFLWGHLRVVKTHGRMQQGYN